MPKRATLAPLTLALATACGGAHLNERSVDEVSSTLRAAEEVGAEERPQASLHLHLASEQLKQAQAFAEEGEGERARLMLKRAEADAKLALQLAHTGREQERAREAWTEVQDVQQRFDTQDAGAK